MAITVDLGIIRSPWSMQTFEEPKTYIFGPQLDSYNDPDVVYTNELENITFSHPITGMDYRDLYMKMIESGKAEGEVIFTNNPLKVYDLGYINGVCIASVHEREKQKELFESFGAMVPVISLQDIGPGPWGVIGSNFQILKRRLKLLRMQTHCRRY